MTWKKSSYSESERLIIQIDGKQFEGSLQVDKRGASFNFNSLGIHKKIKLDTKENMKKEALTFLSQKIEKRITELKKMNVIIEEELNVKNNKL